MNASPEPSPPETIAREMLTDEPPKESGRTLWHMARGSAWMVGARWSVRMIGLLSTIILARLLRPEDFGLVAMGSIVLTFVHTFASAGQEVAVIRHPNPTREHYDTAWTMSVCLRTGVALALVAIAPLGGLYFHEPRAVPVIQFLALKPFINGFTNIGVVNFRRDLRFHKEFQFMVVQKVTSFVVSVTMAIVLRNYWALVIGSVSGEVLSVAISYRMHPYRPRFCLTKLREMWSFSAWTQLATVANFASQDTDLFVIGGLLGTAPMGGFGVASDLASVPTRELVVPPARALLPVYATLLHDEARLVQSYLSVLSVIAVIALSTGIGVSLVSGDAVAVVLGPKWLAIAPLVPWLAVSGAVEGVSSGVNTVINVTGHARVAAMRAWAFIFLLAPATIAGAVLGGLHGVAVARTAANIVYMPVMFYSLMRVIPITVGDIAARLWRPAGAAALMAAVVEMSGTHAITVVPLRLICNIGIGAAVFAFGLLSLWATAGRPDGIESVVVGRVTDLAQRCYRKTAKQIP